MAIIHCFKGDAAIIDCFKTTGVAAARPAAGTAAAADLLLMLRARLPAQPKGQQAEQVWTRWSLGPENIHGQNICIGGHPNGNTMCVLSADCFVTETFTKLQGSLGSLQGPGFKVARLEGSQCLRSIYFGPKLNRQEPLCGSAQAFKLALLFDHLATGT